jgi:hypothetical protein
VTPGALLGGRDNLGIDPGDLRQIDGRSAQSKVPNLVDVATELGAEVGMGDGDQCLSALSQRLSVQIDRAWPWRAAR